MAKKLPPVRKTQCPTCVMKSPQEGGCRLARGRLEGVLDAALSGGNQLCHHDNNKTICRGVREWQLQVWYRMGIIDEPTDEALSAAMERTGVRAV